jgi:pimeloyl-ACP methyl ester carboxylesterase
MRIDDMGAQANMSDLRLSRVQSGPVSLAVQARGNPAHPTIILVHGYPDTHQVWNEVAAQLAGAFHVVSYDVRGAGASEAPRGINPYRFQYLIDDLAAIADAVSPHRPIHLVGNDWGALQGWAAVNSSRLQGRIASFSTAAPALDHIGVWFQRRLQSRSPQKLLQAVGQMASSSYMAALQLPVLPELTWRLIMRPLWPRFLAAVEKVHAAPAATFVEDGINGLSLYRANLMQHLLHPAPQTTAIPVQLLMLTEDRFVPAQMYDGIEEWVPQLTRTEIKTGHWGSLSAPGAFADAIAGYVERIEQHQSPAMTKSRRRKATH